MQLKLEGQLDRAPSRMANGAPPFIAPDRPRGRDGRTGRGNCDEVLSQFGVDPTEGMIVNGHVPVKVEKGESLLRTSGKAVTIDGAFSQA